MRYLLALVMAIAMSTAALADTNLTADPAYGVGYVKERIVNLPADEHKPYLTIFGDPNDAKVRTLQKWFGSNVELRAIKDQTHFTTISTKGTMFRERYAASTPVTPCVRLTASDGTVVCDLAANEIPMSPEALSRAINTEATSAECFRQWRERRNQPDGDGDGNPEPQPLTPPAPTPAPAPKQGFPGLIAALLFAAGGGLFGVQHYKKVMTEGSA